MRLTSMLLLGVLVLPASATAQQTDIANSRDHQYFPRVNGYLISSFRSGDPEIHQFWSQPNGGRDTIEGRITTIGYFLPRIATREPVTALGLMRHYEAIVRQRGGDVLYQHPTFGRIGAKIVVEGREYWINVHLENRTEYQIVVGDRPAPARVPVAQAPGMARARGVVPRGTRAPTMAGAPRLNLGPTVTSFTPDRRQSGELVRVNGTNINRPTAVRFIDSRGQPWEAGAFSYEACSDAVRVIVPQLPAGQYHIAVQTSMGTGQSAGTFTVFQNPIAERPDAAARMRVAMRRVVEEFQRAGMVTPAGGSGLMRRITGGQITTVAAALDELNDVMLAEAEGAVGGPVASSILAVALSSGRPARDVALAWRHCHAHQREMGIGGAGGVARAGVGIGDPPRGEGNIYGACGGANSTGARWHSHVTPVDISNAVVMNQHIRAGTAPSEVPAHFHTETGFAAGAIWYASINDDAWYEDLVDGAIGAAEWAYEHSDTVLSVVKITGLLLAGTVGCVIGVIFSAGAGCVASFIAVAGPIMKETAKILVQEEAITVDGVSKETMLTGIEAIPV